MKIWYNFRQGKDGYPIATPNQKYMNPSDWANIISRATIGGFFDTAEHAAKGKDYKSDGVVNLADMDDNRTYFLRKTMSGDMKNPGYHNLYSLDGNYGSFSRFKNNDLDIVYTFNKDNGMDSFIRFTTRPTDCPIAMCTIGINMAEPSRRLKLSKDYIPVGRPERRLKNGLKRIWHLSQEIRNC